MQTLYEWDFWEYNESKARETLERNLQEFGPGLEDLEFPKKLVEGVISRREELDKIISTAAPEWPIEQINIVDRNVLRLGLYELLFSDRKEVPPKVAINEAIELAKTFGGESSGRFVNGVLGTVYRELGEPGKEHKKGEPPEEPQEDVSHGRKKQKKAEKLEEENLASAVIYRKVDGKIHFAMTKDIFGYWIFPKGHIELQESPEEAALREAKEEIGIEGKIIKHLGRMSYIAKENEKSIKRNVESYLIETEDSELKLEESGGLKEAKWVLLEELKDIRHYRDQDEIIDEAINHIAVSL
jgi:N utilization substance protein B